MNFHAVENLPSELKERLNCLFVGPQTKQGYAKKLLRKVIKSVAMFNFSEIE